MNRREFLSIAGGAVLARDLWSQTRDTSSPGWTTTATTEALTSDQGITPPSPITAMPPAGIDCLQPIPAGTAPNYKNCILFEPRKKKWAKLPRRLWSTIDPNKDQTLLDDLSTGYKRLRALDCSDKRSLIRQTWLHGFYSGGVDAGVNVHSSWAFLPWHRAFLHFHERLLAWAIGKQDFRLPVWDWDNNRAIPGFFTKLGLPTFLTGVVGRQPNLTKDWVGKPALQAWLFSQRFEDFCGRKSACPDETSSLPGSGSQALACLKAAGGAHSDGHVNLVGGAMKNLVIAAGDPIFYAHHANVDRFWWFWSNFYKFPVPDGFNYQKPFYFYDEDQQLVQVEAWQVLNEADLGYEYIEKPNVSLTDLKPLPLPQAVLSDANALRTGGGALAAGFLVSAGQGLTEVVKLFSDPQAPNRQKELLQLLTAARFAGLPVQISAILETRNLEAGRSYEVLIAPPNSIAGVPIGWFSIFASSAHLKMQDRMWVTIVGMIDPELLSRLPFATEGFDLVYLNGTDHIVIRDPKMRILCTSQVQQDTVDLLNPWFR